MENQVEIFIGVWDNFANVVKGGLIAEARKSPLTFSRAEMVLTKEILSWQNSLSLYGSWLENYQKDNARKGQEIRQILTQKIKFYEEASPKTHKFVKFVSAAVGGGLGYGTASFFEANTTGTIFATVIPTAVCFAISNSYVLSLYQKKTDEVIDAYCLQLESFKQSIIAIINA